MLVIWQDNRKASDWGPQNQQVHIRTSDIGDGIAGEATCAAALAHVRAGIAGYRITPVLVFWT
jgi:hypothetical protein